MEEKKVRKVTYSTEAAKRAGAFGRRMYTDSAEALRSGQPTAWCITITTAQEILQAMDIIPLYPENYGAATSIRRVNVPYLERAEAEGYNPTLCAYFKTSFGLAYYTRERGEIPPDAPLGFMANPTFLVLTTRFRCCDTGIKSLQALQRYYPEAHPYLLDFVVPAADADPREVRGYYLEYITQQLEDFVSFLERVLGKKMDLDRLAEVVDTAEKARLVYQECFDLRKAVPSPMPSQDSWACLTPYFCMPGEKESLEFFQSLRDELKYRVQNKIAAYPNEKYRILWADAPPYYAMDIYDWMASSLGVVSAIEGGLWYAPYPGGFVEIPPSITNPYERLAWMYYEKYAQPTIRAKREAGQYLAQTLLDWARDYLCDGAILMILGGCPAVSTHHVHTKNVLMKYLNIPTLIIQADQADPRTWDDAGNRMKIEALVEAMESHKKIRQQEGLSVAHPA